MFDGDLLAERARLTPGKLALVSVESGQRLTYAELNARAEEAAECVVPVLTREFYESIERWDRRMQRAAFDKVSLLARDWRHGSLRALALEGVVTVVTGVDAPNKYGILPVGHDETALAVDKVRYVGDNVACVVATSESIAEKAVELIDVEYELLPAYFEPEESMFKLTVDPTAAPETPEKVTISFESGEPVAGLGTLLGRSRLRDAGGHDRDHRSRRPWLSPRARCPDSRRCSARKGRKSWAGCAARRRG